jgi:lipoprotein-releasing system ATP-binding protein
MQLIVEHVRKEYTASSGPLVVLKDVSLTLRASETLAVVGPSGSGKSTLLNIIGSLDAPTAGTVRLGDREVTRLSPRQLAAFRSREVGFVFQDHHLLPQCTALENVLLPTLATHRQKGGAAVGERLLDRVGLAERMHSLPAQLSGGERQRVAIARAMVNGPALLLCDEPTGNLDHETGHRVGSLFAELAEEKGVILIVVTHNLALAERFSRRMELRDGVLCRSCRSQSPSA